VEGVDVTEYEVLSRHFLDTTV